MAQSKSLLNDLSHALDLLESENARLLDDNEFLQGVVTNDELRMQKVLDENAKLRELAAGIGHLLFALDVDYCAACPRDGINHPCPVYTVGGGECLYKTDLRDLGVGVDA